MEVTRFFWLVLVRRADPSGLRRAGLLICCERVVCSCTSWARSCGVGVRRVCVPGDRVAAMTVGRTDCHARHGAAA